MVPPLPSKALKRQMPFRSDDGIYEEGFIEERRSALEAFVNKIAGASHSPGLVWLKDQMTETWLQATHLPRMRGVCTCSSRWVLIWCLLCFDLQIICRRRILIGIMYRARSGTHKSIL